MQEDGRRVSGCREDRKGRSKEGTVVSGERRHTSEGTGGKREQESVHQQTLGATCAKWTRLQKLHLT